MAFLVLLGWQANAQQPAGNYGFAESTEVYSAVVGTASTATGDDGSENSIAMPFTFKFEGVAYSTFSINTNGVVRLGSAMAASSWTNSLSNTAAQKPLIAPFWDDNNKNTGAITYAVTGVTPNQILEIGWDNINIGGTGATSATLFASFKMRLHETTDVIEFIYGPTMANAGALTASVGINGTATFLSVTPAVISTVSNATANNTISATTDLAGKKFIFTPPAPPTCLMPTALTASTPTATTANLGWTANGTTTWNIEWDTTGFTPGTGTMINGTTTNPHNLIGLTPATSYQFYIQADCGGSGTSAWAGPFTFITPCVAVVAPWSENFENAGLIPSCWNQGVSNLEPWKFANTGSGNHIGNNGTITGTTTSGAYFAWVDDSSPDNVGTTLVSPLVDVSALTIPELSFYLLSNNETFSNVSFSVDVWDGASWHVGFYTHNSNTAAGAWENIVVSLSSLTITGNVQLRFVVNELPNGDFYDDVAIDDVNIHEAPSCSAPSNLTAIFVNPFNALVGWTENGTATKWQVQWGMAGFPLGTGTIDTTTSNPYMVQPLVPEMAYQFYVRSTCGIGDTSAWVGPLTFMTPCVPPTISSFPWTENFDGLTTPNIPCGWLVNNVNADANTWISSTLAANSAPNSLAVSYNASLPADDWAFTPTLNLTGGQTYQLSFAFKAQSATYFEKLKVMYGTAQSSVSMTNVLFDSTFNSTTFATATAQIIPSITGSYNIGFYAYSDANMYRIYVDDITVDLSTSINTKSTNVFTIYPNPNNGLFNVTTKVGEKATVEVMNLQGQVVYKNSLTASNQVIDLREQAKGVYFVNITSTKGVEVHKIIVQ